MRSLVSRPAGAPREKMRAGPANEATAGGITKPGCAAAAAAGERQGASVRANALASPDHFPHASKKSPHARHARAGKLVQFHTSVRSVLTVYGVVIQRASSGMA